jgi:hypothetical protein
MLPDPLERKNSFIKEALKEKFLSELTPAERVFFLRKAKEAIRQRGYPAGELFSRNDAGLHISLFSAQPKSRPGAPGCANTF